MITFILIVVAFVLLLYFALASIVKPRNFPPGPWGIPFLGSFHYIISDPTKRTEKLFQMYGDIVGLKLQRRNVVCIRGYDLINEVMVDNPKPYSDRFQTLLQKLIRGPKIEGIALSHYSSKLAHHRKLFQTAVRKMRFGNVDNIIVEELPYFIDEMKKQSSAHQTVKPSDVFDFAVLNVLAYFVFGNRYSYGDQKFKTLMKLNNEYFKCITNSMTLTFLLVSFVPNLHKLWLPRAARKVVSCVKQIEAFVSSEVEYHKSTLDPKHPRDFIDYYLIEIMNQSYNYFTECGLLKTVVDFFQAGTETTSTTLKWAVLYMVNNPDIQEKVQLEIDTILGPDKLPTYEDKIKMPYSEATIMEVQRKSNLAPFGVVHVTKENVTIQGYNLPKGTAVYPLFNSIHHSAKHWKNPHKFDPENFLDANGQVGNRPAFMPFGGGLRICIGMNLAKQELFLYFVAMMQHFTFLPPPGIVKLDEDYVPGLTLQPKPFEVVMRSRT